MNTIDDIMEINSRVSPYRADENDRVLVILDVRNITCRQGLDFSNTNIDYAKLLEDRIGGRKCIKAVAVDGIHTDDTGRDTSKLFHAELRRAGFALELVPASNNKGKQEGVDVKLALIAQRYALFQKCDVVELITGDGDFSVLVKELQGFGVLVNVVSFYRSLSYSLRDQADSVTILDDVPAIKMMPKNQEVA